MIFCEIQLAWTFLSANLVANNYGDGTGRGLSSLASV